MLSVLAEQIQHLSHDPEQGPARAAELVSQAADLALQEDLIATSEWMLCAIVTGWKMKAEASLCQQLMALACLLPVSFVHLPKKKFDHLHWANEQACLESCWSACWTALGHGYHWVQRWGCNL